MRIPLLAFCGLVAFAGLVRAAEPESIPLFNGRDFDGLHVYVSNPAIAASQAWVIQDGVLRCTGVGNGYVRTVTPYADYKLTVEWRWPNGRGNSGIMLHVVNGDAIWPKSIEERYCRLEGELLI